MKRHKQRRMAEVQSSSMSWVGTFAHWITAGYRLEVLVWIIFLLFVSFFMISPIFGHSLTHNAPAGFQAKDAYWHLAYEERILREGNYVSTPADMVNGNAGLVAIQPPWLYYSVASISSVLGVAPWDVNQVFLVGLMLLSMLIVYGLIRLIHVNAAIFSLPMMLFVFSFPFIAAFTWGQHLYIAGMFFLILSIALILQLSRLQHKWMVMILLGLSVGALNLVHPSELIYFLAIYGLIGLIWIWDRRWKDIGFCVGGGLIGILISIGYLLIFSQTWIADGSDPIKFNHIITSDNFGFASIHYTHFGYWWWIILIGVGLSLVAIVRHNKNAEMYAAFVGFFLIGFGTYLNQWRAYQYRFLWPMVLAFFVGVAVYQVVTFLTQTKSETVKRVVTLTTFSLLMMLMFYHVSDGNLKTFTLKESKMGISIYDEADMRLIGAAQAKIYPNEEVLIYEPGDPAEKMYWMLHGARVFQVDKQQSYIQLMSGNTSSDMIVIPVCEGTNYRKNDTGNYVAAQEVAKSCAAVQRSVCSFGHILLILRITDEVLPVIQNIFNQNGFLVEFNEPGHVLISNLNIRQRCDDVIN